MTVINFPGAGGRNGDRSLVDRAVLLKQRLVAFVLVGSLREELEGIAHGVSLDPPFSATAVDLIDWFIFEWEGLDGTRVLDLFIAEADDLTHEDRTLLEGWYDAIDDIYEVAARRGDIFIFHDAEGQEYSVLPTLMKAEELPWPVGIHVSSRILPVGKLYILSGVQSYGESREELEIAAIERLETQVDAMMRIIWGVLATAFVEHFGSDEVTMRVRDLGERVAEFREFAFERFIIEGPGRTLGDILRDTFGRVPPLEVLADLPSELQRRDAETEIALIADPAEGIFAVPEYPRIKRYLLGGEENLEDLREIVLDQLESDHVPAAAFRRLASVNAERLGILLGVALDDPDFDMEADFEELLEEYKPTYDELEDDYDLFDEDEEDGEVEEDEQEWLETDIDPFDSSFDELLTPEDLEDVRDLPDSECPPGSLAEAARGFLAESERSQKPAAFQDRLEDINLFVTFADEQGIDEVDSLSPEALRRFVGVWYPRTWSERSAEDVPHLLANLEQFAGWLEAERGWRRPDAATGETLARLGQELPRTIEATDLVVDSEWLEEESDGASEEPAWARGAGPSLEDLDGLFVIRNVEDTSIDAEFLSVDPELNDGEERPKVSFELAADVTEKLRPGDYFSGVLERFGAEWKLTHLGAFYPKVAIE